MPLECTLCHLEFNNDEQLNQHLSGRKHKKFESIKEQREKSAKRSIFVSNIKKDTFVKQLEEHFESFGKIIKIVPDIQKNSFAIVEFEDEASIEKALNAKEQKLNGKLLKISRREIKEFVAKTAANSNEGDEKKEQQERLKQEALAVNTILKTCESLNDQVEKLISHFKLTEEEVNKRESICSKLNEIFKKFWPETGFQVCTFGSSKNGLGCKGSDVDMTLLMSNYLPDNAHKQLILPKIVAKQLNRERGQSGNSSSSTTSNGDLDANDNHDERQIEEVSEQQVENSADSNLRESVVKFFNNKEYDLLIKFDVEVQVKIVARIIQRFSSDIKSLKTVTNARCPVVRFFNITLNTYCDLSMNNYLAVENTKLIGLYLSLEPNLEKMIYVLRYWFKHKNLFGCPSKFNTYTITFLIIFYMQARKIGYLPTAEYLATLTDKRVDIHGWNCSFETDVQKIRSSRPPSYEQSKEIDSRNFNDLLKGFFEFYANFPFKSTNDESYQVLNTRSGQAVCVSAASTQLTKLSKYINIQDVFDLSHNLSANVSKTTLETFQREARGSNELLHYGRESRKSTTKGWGLILLMTKKSLPINQKNGDKAEENMKKTISINIDKSLKGQEEAQKVCDFVTYLLKECLLFEQLNQEQINQKKRKRVKLLNQICTQVDKLGIDKMSSPTKRQKISPTASANSAQDVNNNHETDEDDDDDDDEIETEDEDMIEAKTAKQLGVVTLSARRNTWIGRRDVKRELKSRESALSELELERECTRKLAERNDQCSKEIDFRLEFVHEPDVSRLAMRFSLLDHRPSLPDLTDFDTLVHFLHVFVNLSIEKSFPQWSN